jgi:hypothetical protein
MRKAQASASREDFQYHFGAFLALIGGLRQFITVKPHKQWVYDMDPKDVSYCACIDLRNVDVHVDNAAGTPRSEYDVQISTTLRTSDSAVASVKRVGETEWTVGQPSAPTPPPVEQGPPDTTSTTARFFVNPSTLPSGFAVVQGAPRSTKTAETDLLSKKPAVDVAEKALNFYEHSVLPGAKAQGIPIP